jgi:hypothetical protein
MSASRLHVHVQAASMSILHVSAIDMYILPAGKCTEYLIKISKIVTKLKIFRGSSVNTGLFF